MENINSLDNPRNTDAVADPELQQLAEEHPYYALAQFDLLRSFESNRSPAFHQQAAKTALFFSNTYWLSWQLHPQKVSAGENNTVLTDEDEINSTEFPAREIVEEVKTKTAPANDYHSIEPALDAAPIAPAKAPVTDSEPFADSKSDESTFQQESFGTDLYIEPELHEAAIIKEELKEAEAKEEIAFEPLHSRDYFASQGIKVTDDPVGNDKLGRQMKSFTEWLKSMKKVHTGKATLPDEQTDRRIQSIADESNTNANVVTEAMAEVLIKQGRNDKAREMYHKLSLINPSKSAYFAAKIESLKEN